MTNYPGKSIFQDSLLLTTQGITAITPFFYSIQIPSLNLLWLSYKWSCFRTFLAWFMSVDFVRLEALK